MIEHPQNTPYVSAASIWEIEIKYRQGICPSIREMRVRHSACRFCGVADQQRSRRGSRRVAGFPDHADPFDRMMVAQALHEGMPLVSADPKVWRYHATLMLRACSRPPRRRNDKARREPGFVVASLH
ncbi:type II toxin-antitoxin system VapC family toxin [Burkholderia sp. AU45388]|uniref:type II toxin-antitoxin system VapC family toxin n=1 Tax=Burkholderia sp. AU45388 TaxID=3059206 RepID=UPI0034632A98